MIKLAFSVEIDDDETSAVRSPLGGGEVGDIARGDRRGIAAFHPCAKLDAGFTWIDAGALLCNLLVLCFLCWFSPLLIDAIRDISEKIKLRVLVDAEEI